MMNLNMNINPAFAADLCEAYEAIDESAKVWGGEEARLARRNKLARLMERANYRRLREWAELAADPKRTAGASVRLASALRALCRYL